MSAFKKGKKFNILCVCVCACVLSKMAIRQPVFYMLIRTHEVINLKLKETMIKLQSFPGTQPQLQRRKSTTVSPALKPQSRVLRHSLPQAINGCFWDCVFVKLSYLHLYNWWSAQLPCNLFLNFHCNNIKVWRQQCTNQMLLKHFLINKLEVNLFTCKIWWMTDL